MIENYKQNFTSSKNALQGKIYVLIQININMSNETLYDHKQTESKFIPVAKLIIIV